MSNKFKTINNNLLTVVADIQDVRDKYYESSLSQGPLEIIPPDNLEILNQGSEGACTGFALSAVINLINSRRNNNIKVSPRMLYEMAKKHDEWPGEEYEGSSCRGAIKAFLNNGVCEEKDWPYKINDQSFLTIKRAKSARNNKLGTYYRLNSKNLDDFHSALNETGALFVSANVHNGWNNSNIKSDGQISFENDQVGAHAFAIVGYNAEGFLIQNSWGKAWGKDGLALWTYEDWQKNTIDAWVIRLAIPTPQLLSNEHFNNLDSSSSWERESQAPRREEISGHFVHLDDGDYHDYGRYWSNKEDVKQTAGLIKESNYYEHIVFYFHGGLNSTKDSARRIKAMRKAFLENKIYPYHFMYDTGLMEEIKDVIFRKKEKSVDRVGKMTDFTDRWIEHIARKPGRAVWREIKQGARSPFRIGGDGRNVVDQLFSVIKDKKNFKIHLVGHSAGAIILTEFVKYLSKSFPEVQISSTSLFAPACKIEEFNKSLYPNIGSTLKEICIYNLTNKLELKDTVMGVYRKSLLYLVSNSFEEKKYEKILGMEKFVDEVEKSPLLNIIYSKKDGLISSSISHGGFDNDPTTMNNVLVKILGKKPERKFSKEELDY